MVGFAGVDGGRRPDVESLAHFSRNGDFLGVDRCRCHQLGQIYRFDRSRQNGPIDENYARCGKDLVGDARFRPFFWV